jgi:predicted nucleic acid-binding protein
VRFIDTNVLLYAVSTADDEAPKAAVARGLLAQQDLALSVQVLQEFCVQATRSTRADRLTHGQTRALIESWLRFPVQEITVPLLLAAADTATRHHISYWDAAIVEAARTLECATVLSEDLADGRDYGGVRVENPFRAIG